MSKVVSITTFVSLAPLASSRRVASMPSSSGMRTSIRTTSGARRCASAIASQPVGGLADDLDVLLAPRGSCESPPARAPGRRRSGRARSLGASTGSRARSSYPPLGPRACGELAAVDRDALAHADEPVAAAAARCRRRCRRRGRRARPSRCRSARRTSACFAFACFSAFVRPSCTNRYAVRSIPAAAVAGSPSSRSSVGSPASRVCSTSFPTYSRLGCGTSAGASSGRRSTPTRRRISRERGAPCLLDDRQRLALALLVGSAAAGARPTPARSSR